MELQNLSAIPADLIDWLRLAWAVLVTLVTGALSWHYWILGRERLGRGQFDDMRRELHNGLDRLGVEIGERFDRHESRIGLLETDAATRPPVNECRERHALLGRLQEQLAHVPSGKDIDIGDQRAPARLDALAAAVSALGGSMRRIETTLDMISQHLLRHGHE